MGIDHASVGSTTIVEPNTQIGFRYHLSCSPARIGEHGILRSGTIVYGDVTIGDYFQSGHYTVIRAKVRIGNHCTVTNHSTLEGLTRFGNGVRVMSHVYIPSRTWVGDNVFIGPGTTILNDRLPGRLEEPPTPRGPTIEDDVMIGGGCTILPGVTIGERSFIAAGTLVNKDVPPRNFVIGRPGAIRPLPPHLDRPNSRRLTEQPLDLWHPQSDLAAVDWPADWPERY
jgi:acetyltransferase-like isoleucine patch superfamily enzyme